MWVISEVLFRGIVITAFIKTVTLTYSLTEILIIILSIYVISVVSDKGSKEDQRVQKVQKGTKGVFLYFPL